MELTFKNTFRINSINLTVNLLMIISVVFGDFELKDTFSYIDQYCIT